MMDVLHMFYNFQRHVLHMFYNFQNVSKNNLNIKDMATFKTVALRQRADGFWNVSIRVTHNRKSRYLKTDKIVETKAVNKKNHEVKDPFVLEACTVKIAHFADMLNKQPIRTWSVDDVVAYLESGTADVAFLIMQGNTMTIYTTMVMNGTPETTNLPIDIWNSMQVPIK